MLSKRAVLTHKQGKSKCQVGNDSLPIHRCKIRLIFRPRQEAQLREVLSSGLCLAPDPTESPRNLD